MIAVLRDLTDRIAEGPQGSFSEKTSWFGKKSTKGDNFWRALETNLTKFVAGEEIPEEPTAGISARNSTETQDPRFLRIASESTINKMTSMPNLRSETTPRVYASYPPEVNPYGTQSRYGNVPTESRYRPATSRYDHVAHQSYEVEQINPEYRAQSAFGTPEPVNGGYSSYVPPPSPATYEPHEPDPLNVAEPIQEEKTEEEPKRKVKEEKKGTSTLILV
jgi:Sec23-binding domain of Sec16